MGTRLLGRVGVCLFLVTLGFCDAIIGLLKLFLERVNLVAKLMLYPFLCADRPAGDKIVAVDKRPYAIPSMEVNVWQRSTIPNLLRYLPGGFGGRLGGAPGEALAAILGSGPR